MLEHGFANHSGFPCLLCSFVYALLEGFQLYLQISVFQCYFYEAILLLAVGLNKTIHSGFSVFDGLTLSQMMYNATFKGLHLLIAMLTVYANVYHK